MADNKGSIGGKGGMRKPLPADDVEDTAERVRSGSGIDQAAAQRSSFGQAAARQQAEAEKREGESKLADAARDQEIDQDDARKSVFGRAAMRQQAQAEEKQEEATPAPAAEAAPAPEAAPAAPAQRTYTVVSGDSLGKISQKLYGDWAQWKRIYEANRDQISNPDLIYPGQTFVIPD